jgi:hypothetical protein
MGCIQVSLRRAALLKPKERSDDLGLKRLHRAYNEQSVKMKLAHVTDLASKFEIEPENQTWDIKLHPQDDSHPFQTFLFRHNLKEVWKAAGILVEQRSGSGRNVGSEKNPIVIPDDSDDEDGIV